MSIQEKIGKNLQMIILFSLAVLLVVITFTLAIFRSPEKSLPQPPTQNEQTTLLQSTISKTTEAEIEKMPNRISVKRLEGNVDEYTFASVSKRLNHVIFTKDDVVIFEKHITITTDYRHPNLTTYLKEYGYPEETLHGSKTYGSNVNYYIYASKGITVVGRPFSEEIEEIHAYQPMSVAEYINTWGKDILGYKEPEHEGL
jgi:hypothetical protein